MSALSEGVVLYGGDAGILAWNPAALQILGVSAGQLEGLIELDPDWKTIHEDGTPFPFDQHPGSIVLKTGVMLKNVVMGIHKPWGELT